MKTLNQFVQSVEAGARPHVTFTPLIEVIEAYPEAGMKAAVLAAGFHHDGVIWIQFDYEPYREHNLALEKPNYWAKTPGMPTVTCTEAGHYEPKERVYLMGDEKPSAYFTQGTNELFTEFLMAQGAGTSTASTYVEWLEEQVRASKKVGPDFNPITDL